MGQIQKSRHCKYCQRKTLHSKETFSDGMGCLLSIITAGLFIPIWLLIGVLSAFKPMRCQQCGGGKML